MSKEIEKNNKQEKVSQGLDDEKDKYELLLQELDTTLSKGEEQLTFARKQVEEVRATVDYLIRLRRSCALHLLVHPWMGLPDK